MAKLRETSQEIIEFINNIIDKQTTLSSYITWRILSDDKQKELVKISKSSAVTEYFAKMRDSIIIYVNEDLFDRLQPKDSNDVDYRALIIEDALVNVQIVENEKTGNTSIKIVKPNICITSDGYSKYGEDLAHAAECVAMAYTQIQEEEKRRKEEEKEKKIVEKSSKNIN